MIKEFVEKTLLELSNEKDVFYSEFDFQFAFAWKLKSSRSDLELRLEKPFSIDGRVYELDIFIPSFESKKVGIELKYFKKDTKVNIDGYSHHLKNSYTSGGSRYSFINDIYRLQKLKNNGFIDIGFAIVLNNVNRCYTDKIVSDNYAKVLLNEGRQLKKGEEIYLIKADQIKYPPFTLEEKYEPFHWKCYAETEEPNFKYLIISV